jgi:hypothetical protein
LFKIVPVFSFLALIFFAIISEQFFNVPNVPEIWGHHFLSYQKMGKSSLDWARSLTKTWSEIIFELLAYDSEPRKDIEAGLCRR